MSNFKDLTGQKFGRLTVISRAENKGRHAAWYCKCACGKSCIVNSHGLLHGTKSCGCLKNETCAKRGGLCSHPLYDTWYTLVSRCTRPSSTSYPRYGGRGITVCDEWRDNPEAFIEYVSTLDHFGEKGYLLDRINNDGN